MTTTLRCILSAPALAVGSHRLAFDASVLPAGVYVVRAEVGTHVLTQHLTVIR